MKTAETFKQQNFKSDIERAKYLFLKFAAGSFCEIIRNGEKIDVDDANFNFNEKIQLAITSRSGEKYVLQPYFMVLESREVLIYVKVSSIFFVIS